MTRGVARPRGGQVIAVDDRDKSIGACAKLEAHRTGVLHRAVSVFVVSPDLTRVLLQRRAKRKYHSGGLWSNAACTHPVPGETTTAAARRCLRVEMGLAVRLRPLYAFRYNADVGAGLIEHEIDHVFWGTSDDFPSPRASEVAGWKWEDAKEVRRQLQAHPGRFTSWFRLCFARTLAGIRKHRRRSPRSTHRE